MLTLRADQMTALADGAARRARRQTAADLSARGFALETTPDLDQMMIHDPAGGSSLLRQGDGSAHIVSATGETLFLRYDAQNQLSAVADSFGGRVAFEHDGAGLLRALERDDGARFQFRRDALGRLERMIAPDGSETRFAWDAQNRLSRVVDGAGRARETEYGPNGLISQIRLGPERALRFDYDDDGQLASAVGLDGARYAYAPAPDGLGVALSRDGAPVVICQAEPDGDLAFRYPNGFWTRVERSAGRVTAAREPGVDLDIDYDAHGFPCAERSAAGEVRIERNATGAVLAIVGPDGKRISYERDADHRLIGIRDWRGGRYALSLDRGERALRLSYPNGVVLKTALDRGGRATALGFQRRGGEERAWRYRYDRCDRVVEEVLPDGRARAFEYDLAGRWMATRSDDPRLRDAVARDRYGNVVSRNGSAARFGVGDELLSVERPEGGVFDIAHDALGCVRNVPHPDGETALRHDHRGRLIEAVTPHLRVSYAYDPIGRRTRKCVETLDGARVSRTAYVWVGGQLLSETTERPGRRAEIRRYLPVPELGAHLAQEADGAMGYLHPGRRSEILAMTDAAGRIQWEAEYDAYGAARVTLAAAEQPFRLMGQTYEPETGLHYNLARTYHPGQGRFLQRDPLGPRGGSWNEYLFGDGDPLNRVDPSGELVILAAIGIGIVAGAVIGAAFEAYRQHREKPDAPFDWGKIGKEAAIGGLVGGVGGAVGVVLAPVAGAFGAGLAAVAAGGAVAGGATAAIETCAEAAIRGEGPSAGSLLTSVGIGAGIGAVTAGVGGALAARAARRAANQAAAEAAERAAKEAADEAAERAAKEAAAEVGEEAAERGAKEGVEEGAEAAARGAATPPIQKLDPDDVRFSQKSVSYKKKRAEGSYTIDDIKDNMRKNGWSGDPVDVVEMPDGGLTSIDNTRILSAREVKAEGVDIAVDARVHAYDEALPDDQLGRFDQPKKGIEPKTWGEAADARIGKQGKKFQESNPMGSQDPPRVTGRPTE